MSIYEKTKVARALLYWAKNNNGNECYYLEDRMYAVADGDKVIILTADSYDEAKQKAKGDYAITIDIQPEDAEAFKKAIENARVCHVEDIREDHNVPTVELATKLQPTCNNLQQGEWIPVSERLPDDETEVLIQYGQSIMVGYHKVDFTVYPSFFEDANETGWYSGKDNFICGSDEVIAWQPLPEPYKKGSEEE